MARKKLTQEEQERKIYENTLHTCVYVSGECKKGSKIRVRCIKHNIEFEIGYDTVRKDSHKRHICPECKREDRNGSRKVTCDYCGKEFLLKRYRADNYKFHFCCRNCKDSAQRLGSGDKFNALRPAHYGSETSIRYRRYALNVYPHKCSVCGWDEDADVLEVHHIDSNRNNNDISNLIVLCPTCHTKLTIGKYELVNRDTIIKKGLGTA